jgi:N-acetylmuramoyl-L-alanine amidase
VLIKKYDGKSIRSSLGIKDYLMAKEIEKYNIKLLNKGELKKSFKQGGVLLVPIWLYQPLSMKSKDDKATNQPGKNKTEENLKKKGQNYPIFGKNYSLLKKESDLLSGFIFYIDSGHGGPDPGAIGKYNKKELHEDEYAYDVSLRLAHKLMANGAEVHIIVQDPDDGIRDESILKNDSHEFYIGGDTIAFNQLERLTKRSEIVNQIYEKDWDSTKQHISVTIHLDSRSTSKRVDVFFYHAENSIEGKRVAEILQETFRSRYMKAQPGRGYTGTVSSRDLFMLREVKPTSIYIELGNIQNLADQQRFIIVNNRQAIANWLFQGFVNTINTPR